MVLPQRPRAASKQPQTGEERNSGSNWPEKICRGTHVIRRKTQKNTPKKKKKKQYTTETEGTCLPSAQQREDRNTDTWNGLPGGKLRLFKVHTDKEKRLRPLSSLKQIMLFPEQQQGAINLFSSRGTSGMTLLPAVALRHLGCYSLSSCCQHLNLNYITAGTRLFS